MTEKKEESGDEADELLERLEVIGNGGWFLWKIFLLCTIPSILNGLNLTSYVYLAEVPTHWCDIPALESSNWTEEQIRLISSSGGSNQSSCSYYNWDYNSLAKMDFLDALSYVQKNPRPELVPCSTYRYAGGLSSMVIDYDLVCERTTLKSMIQISLSMGKFLGAVLFGIISDKYGRKLSFLLGCFIYTVSGPLVAFAVNYSMIVSGRIGLGAASMGIYTSAYVILTEIASKKRRAVLGMLNNMSYPLGQMIISLLAFLFRDWRTLQLMPESPRWLILKGRREEAGRIINKIYETSGKKSESDLEIQVMREAKPKNATIKTPEGKGDGGDAQLVSVTTQPENSQKLSIGQKIIQTLSQVVLLLKYSELRGRLMIVLVAWCVCSLCYYTLAINVDNFLTDRYLYGFISGLVEIPSYILPLPLLRFFGRRQTSIGLFYVGGLALLAILAIPRQEDILLLVVASLGRLCASAVFAVVILHSTELFPTLLRNTAIGCCSTAAHIGSMSAPLIVDILGAYAWFIPSTVCGVVTVLAGTMIFLLPETKDKPLPDTTDDIVNAKKCDQMGFHQICGGKVEKTSPTQVDTIQ
ncbi:hypothetical protein RUM43_011391 [Polyplax serrata]|uniref:Major facilitator superfamily (MFS) profile domain-containing protein n=1 Tax=Polyplax serrata TaxID=468196 RepID=A0AAN8NM41_POLSC